MLSIISFYDIEVESVCFGNLTPIYGCTNPAATNYNANATVDDGSCLFACNSQTLPFSEDFESIPSISSLNLECSK